MTKTQMTALTAVTALFGTREFTDDEWAASPAYGRLSLGTAVYEGLVVATKHTTRHYYSVAEIVDELNACSGEDCYDGHWFYQIDEDGRIYEEDSTTTYHMA